MRSLAAFRAVRAALGAAALGLACARPPAPEPFPARPAAPGPGERVVVARLVLVVDASGSLHPRQGFAEARALLGSFAAGLPGALEVALLAFGGSRRVEVGPARLDGAALARTVADLPHLGRDTRLADALRDAARLARGAEGAVAVLLLSDGLPTRGALPAPSGHVRAAARALAAVPPGPVCLHAVQVGAAPEGRALLEELAEATGCGVAVTAAGIGDPARLHAFQRAVLLGPAR